MSVCDEGWDGDNYFYEWLCPCLSEDGDARTCGLGVWEDERTVEELPSNCQFKRVLEWLRESRKTEFTEGTPVYQQCWQKVEFWVMKLDEK